MSNFSFDSIKKDKDKIGVWLRYYSNTDLITMVKKSRKKRFFDSVTRVVVSEVDKESGEVWLEFWCKNLIDIVVYKKHRYNVFFIKTKPNAEWVCEGDLGTGLKN